MKRTTLTAGAVAIGLLFASAALHAQDGAADSTTDPRWTWDLTELYGSDDEWAAGLEEALAGLENLRALKGTLADGPEALLTAFEANSDWILTGARVYSYASLGADENLGDPRGQERRQQAQRMYSEYQQASAWFQPELMAMGRETLERYVAEMPELQTYRFNIENALRYEPHTLGDEAESVIAAAGLMQSSPFNIYGLLSNSEIPWPTITLSTGEEAYVNAQGYSRHRSSRVREDRKAVFDAFWTTWGEYKGTAGQSLSAHLTSQLFTTNVRSYDDTLTRNLFQDDLPRSVYDTLVRVTNENLPSLHRYLELKARVLGLEDMGYEDIYVSLVESPRDFWIEDTIDLVNRAMEPLGEVYAGKMANAASQRWMHVYPTQGKRAGAYMSGSMYDLHPYILWNHQDDYNSVSTYAHEWGHAMHQVLANETQPQHLASFSIFTTEAAAIANELLTQSYMLSNAKTDQERLYYLGYALEQIRTTFFRQTMFSEFEGEIYAAMERGEPLSGDRITQIYGEILRRYHGADEGVMRIDELYHNEWLFVPHFYFNFYVFQYSTSIAGAAYFTEQILDGDQEERDIYLEFLKAGGSKHPYELFLDAGLDMASPEPYEALIRRMDQLLDDFEATLDRVEAAGAD